MIPRRIWHCSIIVIIPMNIKRWALCHLTLFVFQMMIIRHPCQQQTAVFIFSTLHIYVYVYIVVKTRMCDENKVLNIVHLELCMQVKLHHCLHNVIAYHICR